MEVVTNIWLFAQSGREVAVHRPIRYHNLISITYIRLGYLSSESVCAPWCWTHKRMRLHVLCDIRQALLHRVTACQPYGKNTTKFCGCGISRMHYLGHCCQTAILHCTACCVNLNWVWGAYCLGVRWLLAHSVHLTKNIVPRIPPVTLNNVNPLIFHRKMLIMHTYNYYFHKWPFKIWTTAQHIVFEGNMHIICTTTTLFAGKVEDCNPCWSIGTSLYRPLLPLGGPVLN